MAFGATGRPRFSAGHGPAAVLMTATCDRRHHNSNPGYPVQEVRISNAITVGPAPANIEAFERLYLEGTRTVVNMCAKGEMGEIHKPYDASLMAEDAGLTYLHFPISMSSMKFDHVDAFAEALSTHKTPVYVHCRIGQRSGPFSLLWHATRRGLTSSQTLALGQRLGLHWRAQMITDFMVGFLDRHREATAAMAA